MSATKVNIVGFTVSMSSKISLGEYFQYLERSSGSEIQISGQKHFLLTDIHDDYITGLTLSFKSDKKSVATRLVKDNRKSQIDRIKLREDQKGTEVSFFCINPATMSGLLFSYFGGPTIRSIQKILESPYKKLQRELISEKCKELSKLSNHPDIKRISKDKAINFYSGNFKIDMIFKKLDIKTLVKNFSEIRNIEITASNALDNAPIFSPIVPFSSKSKISINTDKTTGIQVLRESVINLYKKFKHPDEVEALKIYGKSLTDETLSFQLGENIKHFKQMTYDDYMELLPDQFWEDYKKSEAISLLLKIIKLEHIYFGGKIKHETWKLPSREDLIREEEMKNEPA